MSGRRRGRTAPIPRPRRNIFCVGKNYAAHAKEFAGSGFDAGHTGAPEELPTDPIVFTKAPECVIGHGASIWPAEGVTDFLDYEAELTVIIGVGGQTWTGEHAQDVRRPLTVTFVTYQTAGTSQVQAQTNRFAA